MTRHIQQEIPHGQKKILANSLQSLKKVLELIPDAESKQDLEFDIITLTALLNYKVIVQLTEEEFNTFTSDNGVDFPEYI